MMGSVSAEGTMFIKKVIGLAAVVALAVLPTSVAQALSLGDVVGDIARVVTAPIIAPADATIKILRGDNPTTALTGPMQSAGRIIQQGSTQYQRAQSVFMNVPRDAIRNHLGGDWVRAYDLLTASERVKYELATTSGRFLGKCLQGQRCTVEEVTAAPLAAAMRDAYKVYIGHSAPIHPNVGRILSYVVPPQVLAAARITVGAVPDFSVPGMLNAAHEAAGRGHAVALGNLIIFSRPLNFADLGDWNWLLHELRHIEQYMAFSMDALEAIDGFAVNYMYHHQSVEDDAQSSANQRQAILDQLCRFGC